MKATRVYKVLIFCPTRKHKMLQLTWVCHQSWQASVKFLLLHNMKCRLFHFPASYYEFPHITLAAAGVEIQWTKGQLYYRCGTAMCTEVTGKLTFSFVQCLLRLRENVKNLKPNTHHIMHKMGHITLL